MDRNTAGHGSENITTLLAAAGVTDAGAARVTPLTGGTYNTVVRVELADGRSWVIKIPPAVDLPALRYERGLLRGEMTFYEAAGAAGIPVPDVVRASLATPSPELPHLIVTARPGVPWTEHDTAMEDPEKRRLRHALGEYVARFHAVTGPGFGYPAEPLGPLAATWREAFTAMTDAVLADAVGYRVRLPQSTDRIRALLHAASDVLDDVTCPALVHFDLWQGNLLLDGEAGQLTLSALIDGERMFWGDPAADFVSLALFDDIERDNDFLTGYHAGGGRADFGPSLRLRLAMYRCYLYLIMTVETVPRGYDGEQIAWTHRTVRPLLEAALREISTAVSTTPS